ncbi:hypothetical protein ACFX1Z_033914 [Malus domestica]
MKKDPNESLYTYAKSFKVEKAKIIGCDDNIVCSAFRNGLPADHPLFKKLIMGKNLTLSDSYALVEKHSFWNKAKRSQTLPEQPHKDAEPTQKKTGDKLLHDRNKRGSRRRE